MTSPFDGLPERLFKRTFFSLAALVFILMTVLRLLGATLNTPAAPMGIVSFELAGDLSTAQHILSEWDPQAQRYAALSLGIDFLFLFAYPLLIALLCHRVARPYPYQEASPVLPVAGISLAWLQFAAGGLDAVENTALIRLLMGDQREIWSQIAYWSATPKFLIVFAGIAYIILGYVVSKLRKTH